MPKRFGPLASPHAAVRVPAFACDRGHCDADCPASSGCVHAHYKCYVYVQPDHLAPGWSRDRIAEAINAQGVPCYHGSCSEIYLEKAFDKTEWRPNARLPVAKDLGETSLMFLVHPTLTRTEIDKTCTTINQVLSKASA